MKNNQILAILNAKIKKGGGGGEPVDAYTKTQTDNLLLNKVDKEDGKGLFSGSYNDLSDTPTIPTKTSQLDNDSNFATNESVDEINNNLEAHTGNKQNPHGVTKSQIGLGNVENKSSATIRSELTSSNVTTALGYTPLDSAKKGSANGVAELGSDGKVPSSQLPSYVDDVLEYSSKSSFPSTGESGKIYVDISTNLTYRWSGSAYVEISQSLALGETSSTAYRGDRGKTAYEHSQKTSGNPHGVTKSDVGLGNVDNTADNDKVVKSLIDSSGATVVGGKVGELTYYSTEGAVSTTKDIACLEESPSSGGYSLHRMPLSKLKSRLSVDKVDNTADLDKPISTATQTALDEINSNLSNLEVGGTNLLINTATFEGYENLLNITSEQFLGHDVWEYTLPSTLTSFRTILGKQNVVVETDEYYTLSFYAKGTGHINSYFYRASGSLVESGYNNIGSTARVGDGAIGIDLTNEWKKYITTWKVHKSSTLSLSTKEVFAGVLIARFEKGQVAGNNISMCGVKFEKGNKATDWSPAPEDVESQIKNLSDRISALENK